MTSGIVKSQSLKSCIIIFISCMNLEGKIIEWGAKRLQILILIYFSTSESLLVFPRWLYQSPSLFGWLEKLALLYSLNWASLTPSAFLFQILKDDQLLLKKHLIHYLFNMIYLFQYLDILPWSTICLTWSNCSSIFIFYLDPLSV